MKIQKGHYVPKELITSEAIHEAVVKCFVAAGFKKTDNAGRFGVPRGDGLCIASDGEIMWGGVGLSAEEPLTLQQLFTAENGLQWPDFATEIRTDDNAVWFFGGGQAEHVFGNIKPIPHRVLATRQPKEKEVNEALDKAVIQFGGVWPEFEWEESKQNKHAVVRTIKQWKDYEENRTYRAGFIGKGGTLFDPEYVELVCTKDQFTQRAKELGFINGYRWGVEYPTNGKRPDLDVDVVVYGRNYGDGCGKGDKVKSFFWNDYYKFKAVDGRYKPADTSYLQTPAVETIQCNTSEWYDYENQKALMLPDAGTECLTWFDDGKECWQKCKVLALSPYEQDHMAVSLIGRHDRKLVWADNFKPIDHATRKAELEKRTTILAAMKACKHTCNESVLNDLYNKGYLRLPDQK